MAFVFFYWLNVVVTIVFVIDIINIIASCSAFASLAVLIVLIMLLPVLARTRTPSCATRFSVTVPVIISAALSNWGGPPPMRRFLYLIVFGTLAVLAFVSLYRVGDVLALTLSVGFVVDDAIVMLENIYRHVEEGMPPVKAALVGSREISFAIIADLFPLEVRGRVMGVVQTSFAASQVMVSGRRVLRAKETLGCSASRAVRHRSSVSTAGAPSSGAALARSTRTRRTWAFHDGRAPMSVMAWTLETVPRSN